MQNRAIKIITTPNMKSILRLNRFIMMRTKRAIAFWIVPSIFLILGLVMIIAGQKIGGIIFISLSPLFVAIYIYIYISKVQAQIICKSDFQEDGVEKIKQLMNNKLTKKQNKMHL
ncbi:MAG TPA: hypothetical protein VIK72_08100 [Clostridiaceae bacterium]